MPAVLDKPAREAVEAYRAATAATLRANLFEDAVTLAGTRSAAGPDAAVYVISVAAELTGLHPQTLRAYERMGLITPGRTGGGGRRYSHRDLELLRAIAELTAAGIGIEGVRRILDLEHQVDRARGAATTSWRPSWRPPARRCARRCPRGGPRTTYRSEQAAGAPPARGRPPGRLAPRSLTPAPESVAERVSRVAAPWTAAQRALTSP